MTIYFAGADEPEIAARTIYAYMKSLYTRHPSTMHNLKAVTRAGNGYFAHLGTGSIMYSAWLSFQHYTSTGMRSHVWRNHVIMASRAGMSFRRCLFFDYKGTRDYPRVTNRGVIETASAERDSTGTVRQGDSNATITADSFNQCGDRLVNDDTTEGSNLSAEVVKRRASLGRRSSK